MYEPGRSIEREQGVQLRPAAPRGSRGGAMKDGEEEPWYRHTQYGDAQSRYR